jgi:tetratricopeptide (TPR) repeat protein
MGFTDTRMDAMEEAERAYERALSLNPDHVPTLAMQALLFVETGRIEEALEPLRRALAIQPHAADAYLSLTHVYRKGGLLREAVRVFEHGRSLDPTSLRLTTGGLVYLYAGEYDEALELFGLDPSAAPNLAWQGMALFQQGRPALARARFEEAVRRSPESPLGLLARAHLASLDGDVQEGLDLVRTVKDRAASGGVHGEELYHIARLLCFFGDVEAGVRMLEQAVDRGFFPYPFLLVDPFLDSVRDDAGLQRVLAKARARHSSFRALVSAAGLPL